MKAELAVLTLPDACGSEEHCIGVCIDDAIWMGWLPWRGDTSRGEWRSFADSDAIVHPTGTSTAVFEGGTCQS
jgi:hypothetical protein